MIHILTIESEHESAIRLRYPNTIIEAGYANEYFDDVVVRWGNSSPAFEQLESGDEIPTEFKQVINPREAIRRNVRKEQALNLLSLVVNTPRMWEQGTKVPANVTAVHRIVNHHGGNGFNVQTGPFKVYQGCYATEWIPSKTEYRVWFCGDDTMCGIRSKRSPCTDKYPCRSMWGYTFKKKVPVKLHKDTLEAAKAIGLECGAADVLEHNGKYYFLELNSAATIDKQVIEDFYKQSLVKLIKKKYPRFIQ
jgi:hypothetical protein